MTTPCRDEREHTEDHRKRIHKRADETRRDGLLLFARHGVDAERRPLRFDFLGRKPREADRKSITLTVLIPSLLWAARDAG